jgi:hypothetical protein
MKQLTEVEKQVTDETRELLVSLDEKQKELTEYQTNVVNISMYASDLQTFYVLYYFFHDRYILTVFMIFQIANSATRTLMFFTV